MSSDLIASVSVVIPTLGRESLSRALESVKGQTLMPSEILVVVDGSETEYLTIRTQFPPSELIRIIHSNRQGAAQARNLGIIASKYDYIAFLDDDDVWTKTKLDNQIRIINALNLSPSDDFVLSSRAIYSTKNYAIEHPKRVYNGTSFLTSLYKVTWKRTNYCIPTPSIFVPTQLARKNLFEIDLKLREDIHWISNIESKGARIIQTNEILVIVNYDPIRSRSNESKKEILKSFVKFFRISKKASFCFLIGVGTRTLLLKTISKVGNLFRKFSQQ